VATHDIEAVLVGASTLAGSAKATYRLQASLVGNSTLSASLSVVTGYAAPVSYPSSARTLQSGRMVFEPVDLFLGDGSTRAQGVLPSDLQLRIFVGATQLSWPLVTGAGVSDVQVASGKVYWSEVSTGFYSVRFFPNLVGLWRVLLTYPTYDQAVSMAFDVVVPAPTSSSGMNVSFYRR
jgi:hypothetical protein